MAYKHQTESYRDGGKWVCWCDGWDNAAQETARIRGLGFSAKRQGLRVFVLASEVDEIPS